MANPASDNPLVADQGLSKLAHAVRRSTALYVAMEISPENTTEADLLATADRLAKWLRGTAEDAVVPEPQFMGVNPWEQR